VARVLKFSERARRPKARLVPDTGRNSPDLPEKSVYDAVVAVLIGNAVGLARGDDDRHWGSNNLLTSVTDTTKTG